MLYMGGEGEGNLLSNSAGYLPCVCFDRLNVEAVTALEEVVSLVVEKWGLLKASMAGLLPSSMTGMIGK
jgi:hypothetical protein